MTVNLAPGSNIPRMSVPGSLPASCCSPLALLLALPALLLTLLALLSLLLP